MKKGGVDLMLWREEVPELEKLILKDGLVTPCRYDDLRNFTTNQIGNVMSKYGLYTFPTIEVIKFLQNIVQDQVAIEIGAGTGWIGRSLGIPITDSKLQAREEIQTMYQSIQQPVIQYPEDVEELDAEAALAKYHPEVVIGSYVTHKWRQGMKTGNMYGVNFSKVLNNCRYLVLLGNLNTHYENPIMKLAHKTVKLEGLISRGDTSQARAFIWERKFFKRREP